MTDLDGRVAIITGGASGIGFEIARRLAEDGASVAVADVQGSGAAADALSAAGHTALGVQVDVANDAAVVAARDAVFGTFGRIDILVNNAGLFADITRAPFDQLDVSEWRRVLDVNVTGPYLFSRAVWAAMRQAGGGRIVNITSASIYTAPPLMLHYVASKGALTAMTRSMAREMGADGITVNAIAPGFTMSSGVIEKRQDMLETTAGRARVARALPRDHKCRRT